MNTKLVTSLKLSQILEKLGIKQNSVFMWVKYEFWKEPKLWHNDMASDLKITCFSGKREYCYSAFLSGELGEILPKGIVTQIKDVKERDGKEIKDVWVSLYITDEGRKASFEYAKAEAEARGKMLVYLVENKLINL